MITAVSAQAARHNPCLLVRVHEHAASLERDLTALNCNREQVDGNAGAGGAEEACEETYDPSLGVPIVNVQKATNFVRF